MSIRLCWRVFIGRLGFSDTLCPRVCACVCVLQCVYVCACVCVCTVVLWVGLYFGLSKSPFMTARLQRTRPIITCTQIVHLFTHTKMFIQLTMTKYAYNYVYIYINIYICIYIYINIYVYAYMYTYIFRPTCVDNTHHSLNTSMYSAYMHIVLLNIYTQASIIYRPI